jgi:hypothetical protein
MHTVKKDFIGVPQPVQINIGIVPYAEGADGSEVG